MGRFFCMLPPTLQQPRRPSRRQQHVTYTVEMEPRREKKRIRSPKLRENKFDPNGRNSPIPVQHGASVASAPGFWSRLSLDEDVSDLKRSLREFQARAWRKDVINKQNYEWKYVALVLDRLFFFIYIATIVMSLITIFPHA